jgi:hypothetical protein
MLSLQDKYRYCPFRSNELLESCPLHDRSMQIFWYWSVINRTYKCKLCPLRNSSGHIGGYCFQIHTQNYFKYFYPRPVNVYDLKLQDKYNTCALSKHIGKYVYSARNARKGSGKLRLYPRFYASYTYYLYASTVHTYCIFIISLYIHDLRWLKSDP